MEFTEKMSSHLEDLQEWEQNILNTEKEGYVKVAVDDFVDLVNKYVDYFLEAERFKNADFIIIKKSS